jgi:hypothetical protein
MLKDREVASCNTTASKSPYKSLVYFLIPALGGGIALIITITIIVVVLIRRRRKSSGGGGWWLRGVSMSDSTYANYGSLGTSDEMGNKGSMINTGAGDTGYLVSWNSQPQNQQEQEVFANMLYGDVNRKPM